MATGAESESMSDKASDVEQYELTEDEDQGQDHESAKAIEQDPRPLDAREQPTSGKRKRSLSSPDDEERARRRRRRRSLAYKQTRRSLTLIERKGPSGSAGSGAPGAVVHSKQYISDMYSTIIKMSSENKINLKNSWSLHLIDHMEDILHPSKRGMDAGDENTYNFQRASCTLDASIKIYSYRVDDTWNSSYKILENLSRTEQKHGREEQLSDGEGPATTAARKTRKTHARTIEKNVQHINLKAYDTECEADPLFHKMSQLFDEGGARGMLLANLSVYDGCKILLNSSDVSVVTRKSIHEGTETSKKQDDDDPGAEGEAQKAKGLQSVNGDSDEMIQEDGSAEEEGNEKDSENDKASGDNSLDNKERQDEDVTMEKELRDEKAASDDVEMEEPEKEKESLSNDVDVSESDTAKKDSSSETTLEAKSTAETDPAKDVIERYTKDTGDDSSDGPTVRKDDASHTKLPAAKQRISLSLFGKLSCFDQDVQNLSVCPPLSRMYEQLDELYEDKSRHKLGMKNNFLLTTPVKGRRQTLNKKNDVATNLAVIMEEAGDGDCDGQYPAQDSSVDFAPDNADYDADEDNADIVDEANDVVEMSSADDVDMEKNKAMIDLAKGDEEDSTLQQLVQDARESGPNALDNETFLSASATDFFRAKGNENLPENYKNNLFSQMIESALVRSATLESEDGGEDQENKNDYSYFDVKMLRNWAGPSYWKFPAFRKIQMKQRVNEKTEKDGPFDVDVDLDEDGVAVKAEATDGPVDRSRKGSSAGVDKKAVMIDFFGEAPDMTKLKAPKSPVTLEVTKGNLKKQEENAQDLVLPVDTHIQVDLFFRHFLKEKPRFFKKRVPGVVDWAGAVAIKNERGDGPVENENEGQPFTYNEDSVGFEGGFDEDEEDGSSGLDDPGSQSLYSMEGLVQADRVVEKIGVHYERFAKRVDVKKLKGSIWEHLEKKVVPSPDDASSCRGAGVVEINDCGKRARESETDGVNAVTTFGSVVETVAGKVPSNVTVSFYFICILHLANEKGLKLVGQTDLRNFEILKEGV